MSNTMETSGGGVSDDSGMGNMVNKSLAEQLVRDRLKRVPGGGGPAVE
jgi:hypothetical protein